ncbi:valacyclovir hydrolase [Nilaparvata lugens]|uniref:valacyclovir hydrolase n=1 Tax=Nilaparvata lugens TaxID=108931 RepID=UPI00193CFCA6|nr:valacyclovir hydrolase [Nilaparvata lugens]
MQTKILLLNTWKNYYTFLNKSTILCRKMTSFGNLEQKICVDGVHINYLKVGDNKTAHPVLCLPGALGSIWTDFKPQVEGLDRKKLTVIAWDPPGYGKSIPPERKFPLDFFHRDAESAAKLMQTLNIEKYSLLGWSDGGITAMILAAKYPQAVHKLVVWGGNAYVTDKDLKIYQGIRDISRWSEAMRAPLINLYGEAYFKETWESWVDSFQHILDNGGDLCKTLLPNIQCPTFVLHGAKDPIVPDEHPKYLKENIKDCRLHVFENGKHNIHIKYAAEFNKLVEDFLIQLNGEHLSLTIMLLFNVSCSISILYK